MATRKIIQLVTSIVFSVGVISAVTADDRYDDYQPAERFKIRIGE